MTFSGDGVKILKNWQTQKTVLWLVFFEFSDFAHGPEVRIETVSENPVGIVLRFGDGEVELFDLEGAELDETTPQESPFPDIPGETIVRFLYIRLRDGRVFALVERRIT
jgi:hypothetical protein